MPAIKSLMIPTAMVPPTAAQRIRDDLAEKLVRRLLLKGVVGNPDDAVVRDAWPNTEFGLANRWWASAALVSGTALVYVNVALANNKALGVYGFFNQSATNSIANAQFQVGTGATTRLAVHVEGIYGQLESVGYLSEPVIWDPNETVYIQVMPRVTAAGGELFGFMALVAEPRGPTVS